MRASHELASEESGAAWHPEKVVSRYASLLPL